MKKYQIISYNVKETLSKKYVNESTDEQLFEDMLDEPLTYDGGEVIFESESLTEAQKELNKLSSWTNYTQTSTGDFEAYFEFYALEEVTGEINEDGEFEAEDYETLEYSRL